MAMPDEAHIELKQTLAALRRELEARTAECTRHWPGSARRARSFAQSRTLRPTSGRCSKPSSRAADLCDCRVQRGVAARREAPASYWPCTSLRPRWIGLPSMHTGLRLLRFQEARALLEQRGGCLMDVETWLRDLGLEQYEAAFRASEIDWAVLPELTPEGHRRGGGRAPPKAACCDRSLARGQWLAAPGRGENGARCRATPDHGDVL